MAPRAYWKGYLRLSLVSCPISLFPATSESEKVRFHQINRKTGNRIHYLKVDAVTEKEVPADDILKGYEVSKGHYVEITDKELEAISLESTRTIDIDQFVPREEIDELYDIRPYYIAPNGKVGADAFAVIREAIEDMKMVAIGRVVLTSREHPIALEPRGKGIMGTLLRYPYEIRDEADYLDDIPHPRVAKDAMELAKHIVQTKAGHFHPEKFEDRYEAALRELIAKKQAGERIEPPRERPSAKVISLMDALRRSVDGSKHAKKPPAASRKQRAGRTTRKTGRKLKKAGE
jgi:DNA end-binding protein Ku